MVDFDKFEKQLKEKYGNQEFPFDEKNWDNARKMIDASRQGKSRGGIFLFSAVALLCTTGLVYYFGFSENAKGLQQNNLALNQTVTANKAVNENNSTTVNTSNENSASVNENTASKTESSSLNENLNTTSNSNKVNNNSKNNTSVNNTKAIEGAANAKTNNSTTSANESKSEEKANTNSSTPVNETKANTTQPTEVKKSTPAKTNAKASTPQVSETNNNNSDNTVKAVNPTISNDVTSNGDKLGDVTTANSTSTPTKNKQVVTDTSTVIATTTVKPTESVVLDSVPPMRKSRADSLAAMMPKGDGVSYATNVKEKHNAKNILMLEAGTTYLLGWNGGGKNEAGGFNLLAGVNFQHYFTGTLAAQIGVQYSTIANLTNTSHTISTVKYDLGVEQDVTSIRYQTLHYIVAPIKFTYTFKDKNTFGIGANVAYLLNSDSKKEKYRTNSSDPNATKNNLTSTKESGYVQGFNPYDIQLAFSYRRKIYKGFSAGAEFFYGLTDTKNNSFFKSNYFDRNVGFKVSLSYDLFKK